MRLSLARVLELVTELAADPALVELAWTLSEPAAAAMPAPEVRQLSTDALPSQCEPAHQRAAKPRRRSVAPPNAAPLSDVPARARSPPHGRRKCNDIPNGTESAAGTR